MKWRDDVIDREVRLAELFGVNTEALMREEFLSYRRYNKGGGMLGNERYEDYSHKHDYFRRKVTPDYASTGNGMLLVFAEMRKQSKTVREDFMRRLLRLLHKEDDPRTVGWACFISVNPRAVVDAALAVLEKE